MYSRTSDFSPNPRETSPSFFPNFSVC